MLRASAVARRGLHRVASSAFIPKANALTRAPSTRHEAPTQPHVPTRRITSAIVPSERAQSLASKSLFHVNTSPLQSAQQLPSQLPLLLTLRTLAVDHATAAPRPAAPRSSTAPYADTAFASASVLAAHDLVPVATVVVPFVSSTAARGATGVDMASPHTPGAASDGSLPAATLVHRGDGSRVASPGQLEALLTLLARQEAVVAEEAATHSAQGAAQGARATLSVLQRMQADLDDAASSEGVTAPCPGPILPSALESWCSALVAPRLHVPSAEAHALARGGADAAANDRELDTRPNPLADVFSLRPGTVVTFYAHRARPDDPPSSGASVAAVGVSQLPVDGPVGAHGTAELLAALAAARDQGALGDLHADLHRVAVLDTPANPEVRARLPPLVRYVLEHEHDPAALAVVAPASLLGLAPAANASDDAPAAAGEGVGVCDPDAPALLAVLDPNQSATGASAAMLRQQALINRYSSAPEVAVEDGAVDPDAAMPPPPPPELPVLALHFTLDAALAAPGAEQLASVADNVHSAATHVQPLRGWALAEDDLAARRNHQAVFRVYKEAWEPRSGKELAAVVPINTIPPRGRERVRRDPAATRRAPSPRSHSIYRQPVPALALPPSDPVFAELAPADSTFAALAAAAAEMPGAVGTAAAAAAAATGAGGSGAAGDVGAGSAAAAPLPVLTVTMPPDALRSPLLRGVDRSESGLSIMSLTVHPADAPAAPRLLLSEPMAPEAGLYSLAWPSIVRALFPALSRTYDDLASLTHASLRVTRYDAAAADSSALAHLFDPPGSAADSPAIDVAAAAEGAEAAPAHAYADGEAPSLPSGSSSSFSEWRRAAAFARPHSATVVTQGTIAANPGMWAPDAEATSTAAAAAARLSGGLRVPGGATGAAAVAAAEAGARADSSRVVLVSAVTAVSPLSGGERTALMSGATHVTGKAVTVSTWVCFPVYSAAAGVETQGEDVNEDDSRRLIGVVPIASLTNKFTVLRGDLRSDRSSPGFVPEEYSYSPFPPSVAASSKGDCEYEYAFTTTAPLAPFLDGLAEAPGARPEVIAALRDRAAAAGPGESVVPASFTVSVPLGLSQTFALASGDHNPVHASAPVASISPLTRALQALRSDLAASAPAAAALDAWGPLSLHSQHDAGDAERLVEPNKLLYIRPTRLRARKRVAAAVLRAMVSADVVGVAEGGEEATEEAEIKWVDVVRDMLRKNKSATSAAPGMVGGSLPSSTDPSGEDVEGETMILHTTMPVHGIALTSVLSAAIRKHLADDIAASSASVSSGSGSGAPFHVTKFRSEFVRPVTEGASLTVQIKRVASVAAPTGSGYEHSFTFQVRGLGLGVVPLSRTRNTPSLASGADQASTALAVTPSPIVFKPTSCFSFNDPLIMKGGFSVETQFPRLTAFCVPSSVLKDPASLAPEPTVTAALPLSFVVFGGQGGQTARSAGLAAGFLPRMAGADVEGSDAFIDTTLRGADAQQTTPPENAVGAAVWSRVHAWARDSYGIPLDHIVNFNPSALRISLEDSAVRSRWHRLLRTVIGAPAADAIDRDALPAAAAASAAALRSGAAPEAAATAARETREGVVSSVAAEYMVPNWLLERYADVSDESVASITLLGPATPTSPSGSSLAVRGESPRQGLLCHTHFQQLAVWAQELAIYAQTQSDRRATAAAAAGVEANELPPLYEIDPDALYAGHSLGEFTVLAALTSDLDAARPSEGKVPLETLAELVFLRGWLLQRCVPRDSLGRSRVSMAAVFPSRLPFLTGAAGEEPEAAVELAVAAAKGALERSSAYSSVSSYRVHLGEVIAPRWYENDDPHAHFLRLLTEVTKIEIGRALAMMKETLLRVPERRVRSDPGIVLEVVNHNSDGQQYMLAGSHLLLETFRQVLTGLLRQRTVPSADTLVTVARTSASEVVGAARADISKLLADGAVAGAVLPDSCTAAHVNVGRTRQRSATAAHAYAMGRMHDTAKLVAAAADDAFPRIGEAQAQFGDETIAPVAVPVDPSTVPHTSPNVPFVPFGHMPASVAPTAPRVRSWLCVPRSSRVSMGFASVDAPFHSSMLAAAVGPFRAAILRVLRGGGVFADPEPGAPEPDLSGLSGRYVPNVMGDIVFSLSPRDPSLASADFVVEAARKLGFALPNGYSMPAGTLVAELLARQIALPVLWGRTQSLLALRLPLVDSKDVPAVAPPAAASGSGESVASDSAEDTPSGAIGLEVSPEPVLGPMMQRFLAKPSAATTAGAAPSREWGSASVAVTFAPNVPERNALVWREAAASAQRARSSSTDEVKVE